MDKWNISGLIDELAAKEVDKIIDYAKFNHYSITLHSTAIEGSTLTLSDTQLLLEDGITPKGKPLLHSLMVQDHHNALRFTLEQAKQKVPISVAMIQLINSLVMKSTGSMYHTALGNIDASKGDFRKMNNRVANRYFLAYDKVENATKELVEFLKNSMQKKLTIEQILELSFTAHFRLVTIHPFVDGNGRTSRLIENYCQHYFGLPLGRVYLEDKSEYFDALEEARNVEDISPFHEFMFNQYRKHLNQELAMLKDLEK